MKRSEPYPIQEDTKVAQLEWENEKLIKFAQTVEFPSQKLLEAFPNKDLEWRIQSSGFDKNNNPWGIIVPYVSARAVQDRLDQSVGAYNWKTDFHFPDKGVLCTLSIRVRDEWVSKQDVSDFSQIEPLKGGVSGAFKRAAVQWGIGRYLYETEVTFATFVDGHDKTAHSAKVKDKSGAEHWVKWVAPGHPSYSNANSTPKPPQTSTNAPKSSQPVEMTNGPQNGSISEKQAKRFWAIWTDSGLSSQYRDFLLKKYNAPDHRNIRRTDYDNIIAEMEKKKSELPKIEDPLSDIPF